jgi:hypothetical protein
VSDPQSKEGKPTEMEEKDENQDKGIGTQPMLEEVLKRKGRVENIQ